ncbi:hypothetical protein [Kitasatospora sp. NPDC004272]
MELLFDGITPLPRAVLLGAFLLRPDFEAVMAPAVLLAAGDRVSHLGTHLAVTSPTGVRRILPIADAGWICR